MESGNRCICYFFYAMQCRTWRPCERLKVDHGGGKAEKYAKPLLSDWSDACNLKQSIKPYVDRGSGLKGNFRSPAARSHRKRGGYGHVRNSTV
jgi:hypothetical protein